MHRTDSFDAPKLLVYSRDKRRKGEGMWGTAFGAKHLLGKILRFPLGLSNSYCWACDLVHLLVIRFGGWERSLIPV